MIDRLRNSALPEPPCRGPEEVVEVSLLLPGWQVSALERAAHARGLTAGEMVRALVRDYIAGAGPNRPAALAAPSP